MKASYHILFLLFILILLPSAGDAQITNQVVEAKIKTDTLVDIIKITGVAKSKTNLLKSLRYVMYVYKENSENGNVAKNDQSGRLVLQAGEQKQLSIASVNKYSKDKVTAVLLIYDDKDKLVAKDRVVVLNNDEVKEENPVSEAAPTEENFGGIRGIVTEATKTKPGRDFYLEFYSIYRLQQINGREVVKINERFSFGRNTIMEIIVGNTVVHRFFVQPRRDFIQEQAKIAIINVSRYFIAMENNKNLIRQY